MPVAMRRREVPPLDELLAALAEAGVADAPREAPDHEALRGLLDMALWAAELRKRVSFPDFSWSDPRFVATDDKATLEFAYTRLPGATLDAIRLCLEGNLDRMRGGRTLLAIDARGRDVREFDLGHALYGRVTLFQHPHKPSESADPRIDAAREAGWARTLKEHNLLPGRGIVVLDEHQGLILRDERFRAILGFLVLFDTGHTTLWWNPFAHGADAELQYWPAWGPGAPASAWREVFRADAADE